MFDKEFNDQLQNKAYRMQEVSGTKQPEVNIHYNDIIIPCHDDLINSDPGPL